MEFFALALVLFIVFISCCLAIIFTSDSDILTFLAEQFGKDPAKVFSGKVVWITGASEGIGEQLAKELFRLNAKIIISARRKVELERVKKECLASNPNRKEENIIILPFDMTDLTEHENRFNTIISEFEKLDLLISNAGRSQRAFWHEIDVQVDKDLFELNVFSLVHLTRIVQRHFLEVGGGQLAVTSSMAGVIAVPNSASYTASKFALHGYFGALRNETRGKNIDVTLLCPGPTFSGFMRNCFTDKTGETFKGEMKSTDNRMTGERCARLCLVAIANGIEESWISVFPFLQLAYLQAYFPYISAKFSTYLGKTGFYLKARDSTDTIKK